MYFVAFAEKRVFFVLFKVTKNVISYIECKIFDTLSNGRASK